MSVINGIWYETGCSCDKCKHDRKAFPHAGSPDGYTGSKYGDVLIPRMDNTMADWTKETPASRAERSLDIRGFISARCPVKGSAYIRVGLLPEPNPEKDIGTFVFYDCVSPSGKPMTLKVQIPTHFLHQDREDFNVNVEQIGKLLEMEYQKKTRVEQSKNCLKQIETHLKGRFMSHLIRKIIVIGLVVLIVVTSQLLYLAQWFSDKGVIDWAKNIRAEYLTGTAISIIIVLLVLLVGPKTKKE